MFRRGHRIRIEISSSNFPTFDRNMNTGHPIGEDVRGIPAMQTIFHSAGCASFVDLPVIAS
jgi:predicted acyl esterase